MVKRENDNITLTFPDTDGTIVQVGMRNVGYSNVLATFDAQISAKNQNAQRLANYNQAVKNAQVSIDASRPAPIPPKPPKIVVADPTINEFGYISAGVESEVPWEGLPEVKQK